MGLAGREVGVWTSGRDPLNALGWGNDCDFLEGRFYLPMNLE